MQIFNLYLKHNIQIISNQWCGTREQQIDKVVSLVCYVHGREPNVDKNTAPNYRLLLLIIPDRSCTELFPSLQRYLHRMFYLFENHLLDDDWRFSRSQSWAFSKYPWLNTKLFFVWLVMKNLNSPITSVYWVTCVVPFSQ